MWIYWSFLDFSEAHGNFSDTDFFEPYEKMKVNLPTENNYIHQTFNRETFSFQFETSNIYVMNGVNIMTNELKNM